MNKWISVLDANPEYVFIPFAKPVSRNPICTFVSDIYRCSNMIRNSSISADSSTSTYRSISNDSSISYNDTRNFVNVGDVGDVGSCDDIINDDIDSDANEKYSFTQDEITMPLINVNNYVKTNNFSEKKIEELKLERRRYKNRGYSKISRLKKKMKKNNYPIPVIHNAL
jgi:hypothetical protein